MKNLFRENFSEKSGSFGTPEKRGNLTIYPAVAAKILRAANGSIIRVAAYVRVSTDSAEQEGSLALQREYFENLIKSKPEYEFVGIYEDDGVSATNVEKRKGFLKMMEDCKAGKIDLILTKSISRFARNLGDLLFYVNLLNSLKPRVEVRFEADCVSTLGAMGEILITVLGLCAQEESRIKSESITWAVDKLFEQGKYYVPAVYGYTKEKGRDNPLIINEDAAKVVRLCFAMTIVGYSFAEIANTLNKRGIKGRLGIAEWTANGIISLLSNEKYRGDLKVRKTVTPNYKTHKSKKNEGEKPKYHIEEHHQPIVPPDAYDVVERIIKNRIGNNEGIPYLKAVPEGALKGFVTVNKALRGYTLNDYIVASNSVYEGDEDSEINIFADKASIFDFRAYDTVSTLLFEDRAKPSFVIKGGKIIFNTACRKAHGSDKAEILFQPTKAILAIRSSRDEKALSAINKPVHLSGFVPVVFESAGLDFGYRYRIYGTKRTKNGENIMLFDLNNAAIISEEKNGYILPKKYAKRFGNGFYENLIDCGLYKIDIEGLWQALQESVPTDSLAEQIVKLNEFCQKSLAEFGIINNK